jgi:hypothetical protein
MKEFLYLIKTKLIIMWIGFWMKPLSYSSSLCSEIEIKEMNFLYLTEYHSYKCECRGCNFARIAEMRKANNITRNSNSPYNGAFEEVTKNTDGGIKIIDKDVRDLVMCQVNAGASKIDN